MPKTIHHSAFRKKPAPPAKTLTKTAGLPAPGQNGEAAMAPPVAEEPVQPTPPLHIDGDGLAVRDQLLPVATIRSSPWQMRKDFGSLDQLADSLRSRGLLQAIVVRPMMDGYELLAGERRLRAAKLLGWTRIRTCIQLCDDATAKEIVLIENLQRKDLNPIEEAQQWQQLLAGPQAPTQSELALRLGVTQGHISNRLRLLKLPKALQGYVISGEMPPSIARDLVRIADVPAITDQIVKEYTEARKRNKAVTIANVLEDEYHGLANIVDEATRSMEEKPWHSELGRSMPVFTPTAEERVALDIHEFPVPRYNAPDDKELRACNAALWDELQKRHVASLIAKEQQKGKPAPKLDKDGKPKPLSAAQQKAQAEEEKRRRAQRREQLGRRRKTLAIDFQRWLIAERILSMETTTDELLELTVLAAIKGWGHDHRESHVWKALGKVKNRSIRDRAQRLIAEIFWNSAEKRPSQIVYEQSGEVQHIVKYLAINVAAAWCTQQLGPLDQAWWNAHDRSDLEAKVAKCGRLPAGKETQLKKGDLISLLIEESGKALGVPVELTAKNPKAGKATKKNKSSANENDDDPDFDADYEEE
jgi:ParB family transcriptional regulator, chromosome partitioning protein